jgi:hypothetical protein
MRPAPRARPSGLPDISRASTMEEGAAVVRGKMSRARRNRANDRGSTVGVGGWLANQVDISDETRCYSTVQYEYRVALTLVSRRSTCMTMDALLRDEAHNGARGQSGKDSGREPTRSAGSFQRRERQGRRSTRLDSTHHHAIADQT